MHRAGVRKYFLSMDDGINTGKLCYCEKGVKVKGQPSLVFIHGFSSNKRTWLQVIEVCYSLFV